MRNWILVIAISIFAVIALVLIVLRPDTIDDDAIKPDSFGADLTFQFDCKGKANPPSVGAIEGFMTAKGFRSLDKVRAGKKLNPDFSWMHVDVVGINNARREITFKGFADQPETYSVSLYSEPPTQHSKDLEDALLGFTEKTLGCKNSKMAEVENPAAAKDLYDHSLSVTEGWFQQAAGVPASATTTTAPASTTK